MQRLVSLGCAVCFLFGVIDGGRRSVAETSSTGGEDRVEALQRRFVDGRFGMFVCFNIMTYGAKWSEAGFDISGFAPEKLDCGQWAEAAARAGMRFGVLTTKHHEGFCLWDSAVTEYDVASTPYGRDVVRQFVDAFRARGLGVGLYYSISDTTHGIVRGSVDRGKIEFIKTQLRELLTGYGKIDYLVFDGWFWEMGHREVPFTEIREFVRKLQPECLVTDHTHLQALYHVDIPYFEGPFGAFPDPDNTMPSALGHCSFEGNGWFWGEKTPNGLKPNESSETIVALLKTLEQRYCNLLLNCMPNREGLLDPVFLRILREVGEQWQPDLTRPPLPAQGAVPRFVVPVVAATASSGEAANLIDARQIGVEYRHWVSDESREQVIVLDLGAVYRGVDALLLVPNHRCKPPPEDALAEGNVLKLRVLASTDGTRFEPEASQVFPANARARRVALSGRPLRYLKILLEEAIGERYVLAEVAVGGRLAMPVPVGEE
ncbi:MAG: hypothetical protein D6781_09735 [Verrucomicrobia bacterium]|nr:MAG: hypothetical protein D6781_09735 [Verrucomicrobiota bacterium]